MSDKDLARQSVKQRVSREFTVMSFVWRFLLALALVFATYNPSGLSAFEWVRNAFTGDGLDAIHYFVIVMLFIGWTILWVATWRALDTFGVVLGVVALGLLVWLLIDLGLLDPDSATGFTWIILVCIGALLGIGLSWSHIWRRLTGQFEVDDAD